MRLGELNITYLNYGRTLFRLGECQAASEAYARALTAPKIAQPTPLQVLGKVEEYRNEMEDLCPATLTVVCNQAQAKFYLDAMGPLPCDGKSIPILPGEHHLRAVNGEMETEATVNIDRMEQAQIELSLPTPVVVPDTNPDLGKGVGDVIEPPVVPALIRPRFLVGANLDILVNAPVDVVVSETNTTVDFGTQQDASLLALQAFTAVHLGQGIYFGISGTMYPSFNVEQDGVNYIASTPAFEAGGLLMYIFPVETFAPFLVASGGYAHVTSPESELNPLTGFEAGGGAGVLWSLSPSLQLRFALRAQYYEMSREIDVNLPAARRRSFEDFSGTVTESLKGQRILLGLGMNFGL